MTWPGPATVVAEMATVGVQDLALYLRKKGWQRVRHPNERLLVFERECHEVGTDAMRIVLAASDDYEDGKARMADAIELLAAIQQVSPAEVLRSVHALDRDIVTVRFTGLGSLQGGLPLDTATRLVSQLRELFAYAACVEENPRPYFARATAIGRSFTERCLFGHTFAGSFGFTIESPTGPGALVVDGAGAGAVDAPFPRRVVSRIVRGIRDLQEAMLSGEPDLLVARYETGLNANLCEVLQETLGEPDDHEMEYGVTWAPEWPVAGDLAAVRSVKLRPAAREYLGAAARRLRRMEESKQQQIEGKVVALQAEGGIEEDGSEDGEQVATILWEQQKGRKLRVRVALEAGEYAAACDAHKLGQRVQVEGRLEKVGKFWKLMAATGFRQLGS